MLFWYHSDVILISFQCCCKIKITMILKWYQNDIKMILKWYIKMTSKQHQNNIFKLNLTMSFQCYFDIVQYHFDVILILFWYHFDVISISFRYYITTISQWHWNDIEMILIYIEIISKWYQNDIEIALFVNFKFL